MISKASQRPQPYLNEPGKGNLKKNKPLLLTQLQNVIKFYRRHISAFIIPSCRFCPTCSAYFLQALTKFGLIKGMLFGGWRILRCNPLSNGGYDPVPERPKG